MKKIVDVLVFLAALSVPLLFGAGCLVLSGSSTDVSSLTVFGPGATFQCEWASPDGRQALLTSPGGYRRLVDMGPRYGKFVIGSQYHVRTQMMGPYVSRTYLIKA